MLVYVNLNFNNMYNCKLTLFNYQIKSLTLFYNLFIISNIFFIRIRGFSYLYFNYFNFFDLLFKNKFYIYFKIIKKLIKKFSFNSFLVNFSNSNILLWKKNFNKVNITNYDYFKFEYYTNLFFIRKLNFLKFSNFFKFLLYWLPLKIINYYCLLCFTFGYKNNLLHDCHTFWIQIKSHKLLFKYHI